MTYCTRFSCAALLMALALTGCATSNPFTRMKADYSGLPADALHAVAADIEEKVAAGDRDPVIDGRGIKLDTPEIKQALHERAIRSPLLQAFVQTGHAYEQRGGLVAILRTSEYKKFGSGSDRDRNAALVDSENAARWALYEGILKANDYSPKSLSAIQEAFAEARIALLPSGASYQAEDGSIVKK